MPSPTSASRAAVWPPAGADGAGSSAAGSAPILSLRSITTRSAVRLPIPEMLVNRAWSDGGDGPPDLVGRVAGDDRQRRLGADAGDAQQQLEQRPLGRLGEAVQRQRVLAHVQVGDQRDLLAVGTDIRAADEVVCSR